MALNIQIRLFHWPVWSFNIPIGLTYFQDTGVIHSGVQESAWAAWMPMLRSLATRAVVSSLPQWNIAERLGIRKLYATERTKGKEKAEGVHIPATSTLPFWTSSQEQFEAFKKESSLTGRRDPQTAKQSAFQKRMIDDFIPVAQSNPIAGRRRSNSVSNMRDSLPGVYGRMKLPLEYQALPDFPPLKCATIGEALKHHFNLATFYLKMMEFDRGSLGGLQGQEAAEIDKVQKAVIKIELDARRLWEAWSQESYLKWNDWVQENVAQIGAAPNVSRQIPQQGREKKNGRRKSKASINITGEEEDN